MKTLVLGSFLVLVACAPPSAQPVSSVTLVPYSTLTPVATLVEPPGLVVSNETPLPTPTPYTYVVQSGDTLSGIAEKLGVSLDDLRTLNPQVSPASMPVGSVLFIPSSPANPGSEPTPTPVPVHVQYIECDTAVDGGLWCFVLVRNYQPSSIEDLSAQVTLVDVDDRSVSSQIALLPLNILPANSALPLTVFFPPEIPVGVQPRVQILTAHQLDPADARYLPAELQNILVEIDWSGRSAQVSGQVRLPAESVAARTIWIAAVAYDRSGAVVGVRRWESDAELAAGESLPFDFLVSAIAGEIERVELAVEARP